MREKRRVRREGREKEERERDCVSEESFSHDTGLPFVLVAGCN
jgi:hypothetical protein